MCPYDDISLKMALAMKSFKEIKIYEGLFIIASTIRYTTPSRLRKKTSSFCDD